MSNKKAIPNANMGKPHFNHEFLLEFNNFEQQRTVSDMEALGIIFQHIILFRKGNFPNQPELGVGIEDYIFELLDNETLAKIADEIKTQCSRFAPTEYSYNVRVEQMLVQKKKSALAVFFYLSKYDEEGNDEPSLAILFNKSRKSSGILSSIYV